MMCGRTGRKGGKKQEQKQKPLGRIILEMLTEPQGGNMAREE